MVVQELTWIIIPAFTCRTLNTSFNAAEDCKLTSPKAVAGMGAMELFPNDSGNVHEKGNFVSAKPMALHQDYLS